MFNSSNPIGSANKNETNKNAFNFGSSTQINIPATSQPTFSFGTQTQQEANKTQGFSFINTQTPSSISHGTPTNVSNPSIQPSTTFSFGNSFQKTNPSNTTTDLSQTLKTQNEAFYQPKTMLQSTQKISRISHYTDLPKEAKTFVDQMNQYIATQTQISDLLLSRASSITELIESVPRDVEEVSKRLDQAATALTSDINQLTSLKTIINNDYNNAKLSKNVIDSVPIPYIDSSRTKDLIIAYFENTSDEIEKRTENYAKTLSDLEKHLEYLEKDHIEDKETPEALLNTLKAEYDFFLALSNNAAEAHDKIKQLQTHSLFTNVTG